MKKEQEQNNTAKTILGLFAAAAAGAALGIAFAPDKGEVTRKKVKKKVNEVTSDAINYVETAKNDTVEKATEILNAGKEKAAELKQKVAELA